MSNAAFSNLKILRLQFGDSDIWPHLQTFLSRLSLLEHLDLKIIGTNPPPGSITFESYYPHLRSLSLELPPLRLPDDLDFLDRHPTIERLSLVISQPFHCADDSLPNLKALSITQWTVLQFPAFVSQTAGRNIKYLRWVEMPIFRSEPMVRDILLGVVTSLTCLELDLGVIEVFRSWLRDIPEVLRLLPHLRELGMFAQSSSRPLEPTFNAKDLTDFLVILDEASQLRAVRFFDLVKTGSVLPESLLQDLGHVPSSLLYVYWEVHPDPKMYRLERRIQVTSAAAMTRPLVLQHKIDWTSDCILDHLALATLLATILLLSLTPDPSSLSLLSPLSMRASVRA
ncbi:hypothetical protein C8R45DRAFT_123687 [Mycena sanguinolenta]|nr:hypothetical protein C8R45DRAFT_123687 [Mycena sanguinolenta]